MRFCPHCGNENGYQYSEQDLEACWIALADTGRETEAPPDPARVIALIKQIVAEHCHVAAEDITGRKRHARLILPRQIICYMLRRLTLLTYEQIGAEVGRDHSTAIHSVRIIERSIAAGNKPQWWLAPLEKRLINAEPGLAKLIGQIAEIRGERVRPRPLPAWMAREQAVASTRGLSDFEGGL